MHVTKTVIHHILPRNGLVGFADIVLDNSLSLRGTGIHKRVEGLGFRLTYATKRAGLHDTNLFSPITVSLSHEIEVAIFQ